MFCAIGSYTFDPTTTVGVDRKALKSIIEKLKHRFPFVIKASKTVEDDGEICIVFSGFMENEGKLSLALDELANACETLGLGRVDDERSVLDHIDNFFGDD